MDEWHCSILRSQRAPPPLLPPPEFAKSSLGPPLGKRRLRGIPGGGKGGGGAAPGTRRDLAYPRAPQKRIALATAHKFGFRVYRLWFSFRVQGLVNYTHHSHWAISVSDGLQLRPKRFTLLFLGLCLNQCWQQVRNLCVRCGCLIMCLELVLGILGNVKHVSSQRPFAPVVQGGWTQVPLTAPNSQLPLRHPGDDATSIDIHRVSRCCTG